VRHHELLVAEQVLLEQTLRGAVGVLVDMLGLIHPVAFGRTTRVVELVAHLVRPYQLADAWQLDLAAMLSQLGCVTLDATLIEAAEFGPLDPPQRAAFARHPAAGAGFLARIPRLDGVAAMVAAQLLDAPPAGSPTVQLGGEALQLAIQVDRDHGPGVSLAEAVGRTLARRPWTPQLATSLRSFRPAGAGAGHTLAALSARDLRPRMILEENATSQRGELWLAQGLVLTEVAVQRLRALAERGLLREPVAVRIEPLD